MRYPVPEWVRQRVKPVLYRWGGRKPWSRGYLESRNAFLCQAMEAAAKTKTFAPANGYGRGFDERVVEFPWLVASLPPGELRVLDAGSTLNHDYVLDRLPLERLRLTITTLAPEPTCYWRRGISYLYEDLRAMSVRDGTYDCVVSLSVLEHVGMDNTLLYTPDARKREQAPRDYLTAIDEFRRALKPGGTLLLSVPYGRYGLFGWYQQFCAEMLDDITARFAPATEERHFFRYSPDGWRLASQLECDDAEYYDMHSGQPPKRGGPAAAGAVACVKLTA